MLAASATILGSSLMGCATTGTPPPQDMHRLQPADRSVVTKQEMNVQKSDAAKNDTYYGAKKVLEGRDYLERAQDILKRDTFIGAEYELFHAYKHFTEAEKHGVDVSHYVNQIKAIYQEIVEAEFRQLREKIDHNNELRYWDDSFYAINRFEEQFRRTENFVDKKHYDKGVKDLRRKVHASYVDHQFAFAMDLTKKAKSENSLLQVSTEVRDALNFMERFNSRELGLDVKKRTEEANRIMGLANLKKAEFKIRDYEGHKKINPDYAINQLREAERLANEAAGYGVNAGQVLNQIDEILKGITEPPRK